MTTSQELREELCSSYPLGTTKEELYGRLHSSSEDNGHPTRRSASQVNLRRGFELGGDLMEDSDRAALDTVFAYHQRSKHLPYRFAAALGYLDWETQPDPFRRFEGAPTLPLELVPVGAEPRYDRALVSGQLDPEPINRITVSRLFHDALALSAWTAIPGTK